MIHELTTLRRVYFVRAAKPEQNKPVLALLIHDTTTNTLFVESFSTTTTKQSYYILLSDFQIRQNEAWVITVLTTLCACT